MRINKYLAELRSAKFSLYTDGDGDGDWHGFSVHLETWEAHVALHRWQSWTNIQPHDHEGLWLFSMVLVGRLEDILHTRRRTLIRCPGSMVLYRPHESHSICNARWLRAWSLFVMFGSRRKRDGNCGRGARR